MMKSRKKKYTKLIDADLVDISKRGKKEREEGKFEIFFIVPESCEIFTEYESIQKTIRFNWLAFWRVRCFVVVLFHHVPVVQSSIMCITKEPFYELSSAPLESQKSLFKHKKTTQRRKKVKNFFVRLFFQKVFSFLIF